MYKEKIIILNVNIKKFYRICAFRDISTESIGLKQNSLKQYKNFRDYLFGGIIKAQSFSIFIDELKNAILSKIISYEELTQLGKKPFNPMTIKRFFEGKRIQISKSFAKSFLSLLFKIHLIDQLNIIKLVDIHEEIEQDKELLYYYLLRSKDFVSIKTLKDNSRIIPESIR